MTEHILSPSPIPALSDESEHKSEADRTGFEDSPSGFDLEGYVNDFNERIIGAYAKGTGSGEMAADVGIARSLVPPGTAALRDFSYIAPEIPEVIEGACVGCMDCVTQCPDTAIVAKIVEPGAFANSLETVDAADRGWITTHAAETTKYFKGPQGRGETPGLFGLFIDPTKCKGCAECVAACGSHEALRMISKQDNTVPRYQRGFDFFRALPPTPEHFIREKVLVDMMLSFDKSILYTGGAGSCAGCGEGTAIRMMLAATGFQYGRDQMGIVAATGCNSVFGATYPYNPYLVPWTNSLFENAPAMAMGVRLRWNQMGWQAKRLWTMGGDGAMYDIGFQSLSRLFASGLDIKVLVLDTQVYSNTGGQASTASFTAQAAKMSPFGSAVSAKQELRKEISRIAMMHPNTFVAQSTAAHPNHLYRAIMDANTFPGPALVNVYTTCQPEHGVADDRSMAQAKLAVDSRAFPLLVYDPRKGDSIHQRLSLQGNPNVAGDWMLDPKTQVPFTFVDFARTEGRFARQFDAQGNPSETLRLAEGDRLANWHLLQELAGKSSPASASPK